MLRRKRFILIISGLLIVAGVLLMLYPFFTDIRARVYQRHALERIEQQAEVENPVISEINAVPGEHRNTTPATEFNDFIIEIPKIALKAVVLKGTAPQTLSKGPGWYEQSALPGQGNTAIAGHRTMYGGWFKHIDKLVEGDNIFLTGDGKRFVYAVEYVKVVPATDWRAIKATDTSVLTLTTCHPSGKVNRLVVRAKLIDG
ncbi:MAG: class E sortase [Bacillota bacterium]